MSPEPIAPGVGLCAGCRHALRQGNARGNEFWRCRRAERDARFLRYPPLPVRSCPGHEPGSPEQRGPGGRLAG